MNSSRTAVVAASMCIAFATPPLAAQGMLDVPVRTTAGADAVRPGAAAVFWNPGAIALAGTRAEALLLDVRGPSATGLDGLALAGAVRVDSATTLAIGFRHSGIEEIGQTTDSPLGDGTSGTIDISEDLFVVAAARSLSPVLRVGAIVSYARSAEVLEADDVLEIGAGMSARLPALPGSSVGASVRGSEDGVRWLAGLSLAPDFARWSDWSIVGDYGAAGAPEYHGIAHRVTAGIRWSDRVGGAAGLAGEPGADGTTWTAVAGADLRLNRYVVGVVREQMPNGFGAVHTFRLSVGF
jgi:hypothetical protein